MSLVSNGDMKRMIVGQVTANGTSTVTLTVPNLEANSFVHTTLNTVGGTIAALVLTAKTPGANGTLSWTSSAGNTSVYDVFVAL